MSKGAKSMREQRRILLRLPDALLKHIDDAAHANYRTRTAEILARLLDSAKGESFDEHGVIVVHARRATSENPRGDHS
jgi:hypothetical protein